jgi:hypothetical protein
MVKASRGTGFTAEFVVLFRRTHVPLTAPQAEFLEQVLHAAAQDLESLAADAFGSVILDRRGRPLPQAIF